MLSGCVHLDADDGRNELSSRLQYIVNYTNPATDYRSGNEFLWEFDGMRNVGKVVAFGFNGYYYQQTTGDTVNGALYLDGYRGRTVQFGPEIRCHFKRYVMGIKYEKDFLTENRPVGNSFWAQFGIPLWGHHGAVAPRPHDLSPISPMRQRVCESRCFTPPFSGRALADAVPPAR